MGRAVLDLSRAACLYTSVKREVEGFQIVAVSDPLDSETKKVIEFQSACDSRYMSKQRPAVRLYRLGTGYGLTCIVPAAADYTGREGNVLAHTVILRADDRDLEGVQAHALTKARVFLAALPKQLETCARIEIPERREETRFELAFQFLGEHLAELVGRLASGQRVLLLGGESPPVGLFEAVRAFLPAPSQREFSFSTCEDNPRLRASSLGFVPEGAPREQVRQLVKQSKDVAALDLETGAWVLPAEELKETFRAYGERITEMARGLGAERRAEALNKIHDLHELLASAPTLDPAESHPARDAVDFVLHEGSNLERFNPGEARPKTEQLICLLPYIRESRVQRRMIGLVPGLSRECFEATDLAFFLNTIQSLAHAGERVEVETELGSAIEKGLQESAEWLGPLAFELLDQRLGALSESLRVIVQDAVAEACKSSSRRKAPRWRFSKKSLRSFLRYGPDSPNRSLFETVIKALASSARSLSREACALVVEDLPLRYGSLLPHWHPQVQALLDAAALNGLDVREPVRAFVVSLQEARAKEVLWTNGKFVIAHGAATEFVDAARSLRAPSLLSHHAGSLVERLEAGRCAEILAHLAIHESEGDSLHGKGRSATQKWLDAHDSDEELTDLLRELSEVRPARGFVRWLHTLELAIYVERRVAEADFFREVHPQQAVKALWELRPLRRGLMLEAWRRHSSIPGVGRLVRNSILVPRLARTGALSAAFGFSIAPIALIVDVLTSGAGEFQDLRLPGAALLLFCAAGTWRKWNERVSESVDGGRLVVPFRANWLLVASGLFFCFMWLLTASALLPDLVGVLPWPWTNLLAAPLPGEALFRFSAGALLGIACLWLLPEFLAPERRDSALVQRLKMAASAAALVPALLCVAVAFGAPDFVLKRLPSVWYQAPATTKPQAPPPKEGR
jgi:hypothetical protein